MIQEQKQQISEALSRYVSAFSTQQAASDSLQGISAAVISQIKNNHWSMISNQMWYSIARQVGFYCGEWRSADTGAYMLLRLLLNDAQHFGMAYGLAMAPGIGKTYAARQYMHENPQACYIACHELYTRKSMLTALLQSAGLTARGTVASMTEQLANYLAQQDEPLLIIDDAHKLKDRVLHCLVLLANRLAGHCGIAIMGSDALRTRIAEGIQQNLEGYDLIYNTIGRRFVTLGRLAPADIELVCRANGVTDDHTIMHITEACNGSLHPVAHLVGHAKMKIAA